MAPYRDTGWRGEEAEDAAEDAAEAEAATAFTSICTGVSSGTRPRGKEAAEEVEDNPFCPTTFPPMLTLAFPEPQSTIVTVLNPPAISIHDFVLFVKHAPQLCPCREADPWIQADRFRNLS
jgi:hypothetical protein